MAQKRKLSLTLSSPDSQPIKRRKMSMLYINNDNNNDEDSDSDFDPYELQCNDIATNTNNNGNNSLPERTQHRYQTRQATNNNNDTNNNNNINNNTNNNDMNNDTDNTNVTVRKRGRPKSKRRKKKSNHIETSFKRKNENSVELRERLCGMDKYDTKQYIESITNGINNLTYLHPFISKPTLLPKRRIRKIMKLDPMSFKLSAITVELMAILIEIFISDLVQRSYKYTIKDNRRSLQLQDVCRAVQSDHMYDFLIDIIPRIQSYDQQNNIYNFIYTSQMQNCLLTNNPNNIINKNNNKKNNDENGEEKRRSVENDIDTENNNHNNIRRSERIKSKRSDKEEAD